MKKTLTIILIIVFLFSFGCVKKDGGGIGSTSEEAFKFSGNNGLKVDFQKGAPPLKNNWVKKPIKIILEVTNRGAIDLASGEIEARIWGAVTTANFEQSLSTKSNDKDLPSAEKERAVTDTTIDLGTITYAPEDEMIAAQIEPKIQVEVCFPYKTSIVSDHFWMSYKSDEFGSNNEIKLSLESSAAPVQVKNFKESLGGDEIFVEFEVRNVGGGEVASTCFPEKDDLATVDVEIYAPLGMDCTTLDGGDSGSIELIEGKSKVVRCSIPAPTDKSYPTQLSMELTYNYDLELDEKITIKNTA